MFINPAFPEKPWANCANRAIILKTEHLPIKTYCFSGTPLFNSKSMVYYDNVTVDEVLHQKKQSHKELALQSHDHRPQQDQGHHD